MKHADLCVREGSSLARRWQSHDEASASHAMRGPPPPVPCAVTSARQRAPPGLDWARCSPPTGWVVHSCGALTSSSGKPGPVDSGPTKQQRSAAPLTPPPLPRAGWEAPEPEGQVGLLNPANSPLFFWEIQFSVFLVIFYRSICWFCTHPPTGLSIQPLSPSDSPTAPLFSLICIRQSLFS